MLADIVVIIHCLWILFLIVGVYWGRKNRIAMVVHAAGLGFSVVSQSCNWYCPLTHLEDWLATKQNELSVYPGSFIAHYAEKIVYINLSPKIIFILTIVLVGVNAGLYCRTKRKKKNPTDRRNKRSPVSLS